MAVEPGRQARARPRVRGRDRLRRPLGFRNLDLPNPGLYPVASIATAALSYGVPELVHGSGFLSVYIAALILGTGPCPRARPRSPSTRASAGSRRSRSSPCSGCSSSPAGSGDVAGEGLLLSAALIFVARPAGGVRRQRPGAVRQPRAADARLGRACAARSRSGSRPSRWSPGSATRADLQHVFFVVVTSTLIQGTTFEPLAQRLGRDQRRARPAAAADRDRDRSASSAASRSVWRIRPGDAAVGHMVKELGLPREAIVNLIVRDG